MKLLIGLGNPGRKYLKNRHNVGHMFIDFMNREYRMENKEANFMKTDCFMNISGKFVKKHLPHSSFTIAHSLFIVHDDLDIPFGSFKIQLGTGPKVHNGLNSIEVELGTDEFWRVRIGVDARDPAARISGEEYVLEDFTPEEITGLPEIFDRVATRLATI